jgi:6-phosphogluconolactonase/glucosamine-6-phosphate isomerase/deaminase
MKQERKKERKKERKRTTVYKKDIFSSKYIYFKLPGTQKKRVLDSQLLKAERD